MFWPTRALSKVGTGHLHYIRLTDLIPVPLSPPPGEPLPEEEKQSDDSENGDTCPDNAPCDDEDSKKLGDVRALRATPSLRPPRRRSRAPTLRTATKLAATTTTFPSLLLPSFRPALSFPSHRSASAQGATKVCGRSSIVEDSDAKAKTEFESKSLRSQPQPPTARLIVRPTWMNTVRHVRVRLVKIPQLPIGDKTQ